MAVDEGREKKKKEEKNNWLSQCGSIELSHSIDLYVTMLITRPIQTRIRPQLHINRPFTGPADLINKYIHTEGVVGDTATDSPYHGVKHASGD